MRHQLISVQLIIWLIFFGVQLVDCFNDLRNSRSSSNSHIYLAKRSQNVFFANRNVVAQQRQSPLSHSNQHQYIENVNDIYFNPNDLELIEMFIKHLKHLNGDWSKHGLQRIIRLNSACSHNYVSLRNSRIKADVPIDETFKDPYSEYSFLLFFVKFILLYKIFFLFFK